jgi:transglutaminase-like putative cysteine protease
MMRISIGHVTRYTYNAPTRYSILSLKLTPPSFKGQRIIEWNVTAPGIELARAFKDGFGNTVHLTTNTSDHTESLIIAKGVVETDDTAGVVRGLPEVAPINVYLRQTRMTNPSPEIAALSTAVTVRDDIRCLHDLMHAVRDAVDYQIGATHAHTSAAEALSDGKGVCQDHAHIFISAARLQGVPARYVTGYMLAAGDEPAEAHHAWAEAFIEGLGWVGFDPANRICPTDAYVRLTAGLDASSASPIRGTRRGGSEEALDVIVEVQQQNMQQ